MLYVFVLFGKNMDFLKSKFSTYPYEKTEARITDIAMRYNHFFNLKTEVTYTHSGSQEKVQIYHMIGDVMGQKVSLILSDNKVVRNCFVLDWADLYCIVLMGIMIYLINRKCKETHYQAAIKYAQKLYKRQLRKEDANMEEK